jgi:Na+/proline symporter/signal transduction histidine kinase/CheY-like chemotaxis protein
MLTPITVIVVALAYVGVLFAIASYGDRRARRYPAAAPRPLIYALSLAIYCTSWTYFGSVGLAARSGYDFLPIYIGPILMLTLGWPMLQAIVRISKQQNITSIADFISSRYGKNQVLGSLVAVFAVIGIVPYISLQLKAVSIALTTMLPLTSGNWEMLQVSASQDLALMVTIAMACFAALFGTRHIDTTEHQHGLILAIAVESIVKLAAFLIVGFFVTFAMMGGLGELIDRVTARPDVAAVFTDGIDGTRWLTMTLLSMFAIVLLPRQFHVTVVENSSLGDVKRAAWLLPLYLVAINLFVVPIAMAGILVLGNGGIDADTYVLALPVSAGSHAVAFIAFIGGLSAATAMVIVETVALAIMVCNNIVVPILVRRRGPSEHLYGDMGRTLITIRRGAIALILVLAYSYYRMIGSSAALAQTGLLSFVAVAQFAPAFFGALFWRNATARGALSGLFAGIALWVYTLLLPNFADAGWIARDFVANGPWGIDLLNPHRLFGLEMEPLTHGVAWSLGVNLLVYVAVSLSARPTPVERLQASAFAPGALPQALPNFRMWRTVVTVGQIEATVARYLGAERTERALEEYALQRKAPLDREAEADSRFLRFAEHLLASAIGPASARLVLSLLLERHSARGRGALRLLDDASQAIQHNRDLLQSAIDHVRQGIAVFDKDLNLICWNRQFRHLLDLPDDFGRVGVPLGAVLEAVAANAGIAAADVEREVALRIRKLVEDCEAYEERLQHDNSVLEVRSSRMPDGGVVITFADITDKVEAADVLQRVNESLERRVEERTAELTRLNDALQRAKAEAEAANLGKTRFIAAASHDILQPLNAARLFTSSLVERQAQSLDGDIVRNVDASLEAVEDILSALLDISRLDAGAMKPELSVFPIDALIEALANEFSPAARAKGISLKVVHSSLHVRSDRRMLRRVLQNLLSNAIKYTRRGQVLIGCRRRGEAVRIEVHDSGPGIPEDQCERVFVEFQRLEQTSAETPGLGLGLSIVQRMAHVLGHPLELASRPGRGTRFSITVPVAPAVVARVAERVHARRLASGAMQGALVLVVDNEPAIIEGMRALLSGWGCEVLPAAGTREAVAALRTAMSRLDLVIADYHLHRDDGLALISSLRQEAGRDLPAILATADGTVAVQEAARRQGVLYMRKPVKPAALRAAMSQILARTQAAE